MDDIVKQALAKWPNVPDCYGWLGLDARGRWFMRDDAAQASGDFPQSRGSWLRHEKLIDFIGRNYESDDEGDGSFRTDRSGCTSSWSASVGLAGFAGLPPAVPYRLADQCWGMSLDEEGRLYIASPQGLGLVHSQDMVLAAEAVEQGVWVPRDVVSADLPAQYGFVRSPAKSQRR